MILGIGTDIVRTSRFTEILLKNPHRLNRLAQRILHNNELQKLDLASPSQQLASAWAAKEAVYKSLNVEEQRQCRFNHWQKVWRNGRLEMVHDLPRNDTLMLSISHDGDYTLAMVVRSN